MSIPIGASMIEFMISLFILSIMLLGVDAVEMLALKGAVQSYYLAFAVRQVSVIQERLILSDEKDARIWLIPWNRQNKESLPDGWGELSGTFPDPKLKICWKQGHGLFQKQEVSSFCLQI